MIFFYVVRADLTSSSTRTLIEPVVQTLAALRQAMRCSWGTTWFPDRPSGRPPSPVPALRMSIVSLPTAWLRPLGCQLLHELQTPLSRCTLVYYDNIIVVYLSTNPVQYQRTKHVEIDLYFVRGKVAIGQNCVLHVLTISQFTDIFTKGLPPRCLMSFGPVSIYAVSEL
jgi:hypothetical protein